MHNSYMEKINVIIIDDDIAFCEALKFWFEIYDDINLMIYHDGVSFLNEYSNNHLGFLLIDLFMPEMDGITLLEELKHRKNKMPIIVISGHADNATVNKIKKLGANEFLPKPFDAKLLLEKIQLISSQHLAS